MVGDVHSLEIVPTEKSGEPENGASTPLLDR